ncbi:MAG TPA: PDZ domain-containing protein [Kofleriaceae bacterium]|jgi:hypothetical protein
MTKLIVAAALAACAPPPPAPVAPTASAPVPAPDPYREYYQDRLGGRPVGVQDRLELPDEPPLVFHGTDLKTDAKAMLKRGFFPIGSAEFFGGVMTPAQSEALVRSVAVEHTVAETYLYDVPTADGRVEHQATFWVRVKPLALGTVILDLTKEQRGALGRDEGAIVTNVIEGSPASLAGMLDGDVLLRFDGQTIVNRAGLLELIARDAGRRVSIDGMRHGEHMHFEVQLGALATEAAGELGDR